MVDGGAGGVLASALTKVNGYPQNQVAPLATGASHVLKVWERRARLAVAVAVVWAVLRFGIEGWLLPPGLHRPVTLAVASGTVLTTVATAAVVIAGAYFGRVIIGTCYPLAGLLTAALSVAVWPIGGGTMTDYLMLAAPNGAVGPPRGATYVPLVGEYVVWLVVMLLAAGADAEAGPTAGAPLLRRAIGRVRRALAPAAFASNLRAGLLALVITGTICGLLMVFLTGPATSGNTLRGQVYFAVAASSAAGVIVARRLTGVVEPIFYWPAPILAGLVGVIVATMRPDLLLPPPYNQLNSIPAWGLARALPAEMAGVGISACWWALQVGRDHKKAG
jgi:hypothetical protein